jgi:hypothetical protein
LGALDFAADAGRQVFRAGKPIRSRTIRLPRAVAVVIPAAMPTVAAVAESDVAINFLTDLEFAELDVLLDLNILVDLDVLVDLNILVDLYVLIDLNILLLRLRIRWRRDRDSEPKRGKDG